MGSLVLLTPRLVLRSWQVDDIPQLLPLISAREVAATTLRIPHPYTQTDAEEFVRRADQEQVRCAILLAGTSTLIGGVGLRLNRDHNHAEIGYWLGVPYWGKGYATEASAELLRYGFEDLKLHRIYASHFAHNPASGDILRKIGMKYEGRQRGHLMKWDEYLDLEMYGIVAQDFVGQSKKPLTEESTKIDQGRKEVP